MRLSGRRYRRPSLANKLTQLIDRISKQGRNDTYTHAYTRQERNASSRIERGS